MLCFIRCLCVCLCACSALYGAQLAQDGAAVMTTEQLLALERPEWRSLAGESRGQLRGARHEQRELVATELGPVRVHGHFCETAADFFAAVAVGKLVR